jgi:hypothetical protein
MLCILRVSGRDLNTSEIARITGWEPYRIDREGDSSNSATCLHYDVAEVETDDWREFLAEIESFLREHEQALQALGNIAAVTSKCLDIAIYFRPAQMMMKSLNLGTPILTKSCASAWRLSFRSTTQRSGRHSDLCLIAERAPARPTRLFVGQKITIR